MSEEKKKEELEIVEILQTVVPMDIYFVTEETESGSDYRGILSFWIVAKVKYPYEENITLDRFPIIGDGQEMIKQINKMYFLYHWSEIMESMQYIKGSKDDRLSIERVLYHYNKDFDNRD